MHYKEVRIEICEQHDLRLEAIGITNAGKRDRLWQIAGYDRHATLAKQLRRAVFEAKDILQGKDPGVSTNRVVVVVLDRARHGRRIEHVFENKIVVKDR